LYTIVTTLFNEELQYKLRANKFGFDLWETPFVIYDNKWIDKIAEKYKIHTFTDYTKNIYGKQETHHLGIFHVNGEQYKLTAGIHVHFSNRDLKTGEIIELPIEDIVKKMDKAFSKEIKDTGRIPGEWEPKDHHGFEYRSLPCNVDIYKVLKESFKILRGV